MNEPSMVSSRLIPAVILAAEFIVRAVEIGRAASV
jgi:hypothetical protein